MLQVSGGTETHIHAFGTELISPADQRERRYLRTSPEFTCKKLLAAGEPASSNSPACSATANAPRSIIPNSR